MLQNPKLQNKKRSLFFLDISLYKYEDDDSDALLLLLACCWNDDDSFGEKNFDDDDDFEKKVDYGITGGREEHHQSL